MPKPSRHRLDPASYPFHVSVATRFGDLDPVGHVNNVSVARLFEEARFRFNLAHDCKPPIAGLGAVLVSIQIDFAGEIFHPADLQIYCGVDRIGRSSWDIHQLATQHGEAVAICGATLVCFGDRRAQPMPTSWRSGMSSVMMRARGDAA